MFDITKLALKLPNFLTHNECDRLINEYETRSNESYLEKSSNYKTNQVTTSSFKVVELKPYTDNFNLIKSKTKKAVDLYIKHLSKPGFFYTNLLKNTLRFSHNYRVMKYDVGAEIHPHSDHDPGIYGSISFNLSEGYKGGEFKFFNGNYTVPLNKGDALIFPADYFWVHEVTPVTEGIRYSINSFLCKHPYDVITKSFYLENLISNDYLKNTPSEELLGPYN